MSSRSTSTPPAARKKRSNLVKPITGIVVPPQVAWTVASGRRSSIIVR